MFHSLLATALFLLVAEFGGTQAMVATSYDAETAWRALHLCKTSSCPAANISAWNCEPCSVAPRIEDIVVLRNDTLRMQAFVGHNTAKDEVIMAFRGSENIMNWYEDIKFFFTGYPQCSGCKVHLGFYEVWQGMRGPLLASFSSIMAKYPRSPIFITGHSLGAALAMFAAVELSVKTAGAVPLTLYTFGEPRVGNAAFAQWASSVLPDMMQFRVTHSDDPIPHLPPEFIGYLHAPHEIWYDNDGNTTFQQCNDSPTAEDDSCSDSTVPDINIEDHLNYLGTCTFCTC